MTIYKAVIRLGYTHQRLVKENYGVTYPTLRRVRDGKTMKPATHFFYMQLFLGLLAREYQRRVRHGGDGANEILQCIASVTLAKYGISLWE